MDVDIRNLILEYEVMEGLSTKNKDSLLFAYFWKYLNKVTEFLHVTFDLVGKYTSELCFPSFSFAWKNKWECLHFFMLKSET